MSKAIIVDASIYWANFLAQNLAPEGVEVVQIFRKGSGWFSFLSKNKLDYIFVDDQLANRVGIEIVAKLDSMGHSAGTLVYTHGIEGHDANILERKAIAVGADYCLQKPYRTKTVKRIIRNSKAS